jgi:hypothetical protein
MLKVAYIKLLYTNNILFKFVKKVEAVPKGTTSSLNLQKSS